VKAIKEESFEFQSNFPAGTLLHQLLEVEPHYQWAQELPPDYLKVSYLSAQLLVGKAGLPSNSAGLGKKISLALRHDPPRG